MICIGLHMSWALWGLSLMAITCGMRSHALTASFGVGSRKCRLSNATCVNWETN